MRGDKERGKLLCRACNSGELDIVKEQIIKHKVDPEGWYVYSFTTCITSLLSVLCRCEG